MTPSATDGGTERNSIAFNSHRVGDIVNFKVVTESDPITFSNGESS